MPTDKVSGIIIIGLFMIRFEVGFYFLKQKHVGLVFVKDHFETQVIDTVQVLLGSIDISFCYR